MPRALTSTERNIVISLLELETAPNDIATSVPCSYTQVMRIKRNIRDFGQPVAPKLVLQGRPPKITREIGQVRPLHYFLELPTKSFGVQSLIQFLEAKPSVYLEEMVDFIWDEYDIIVSKPTVLRYLQKAKISRKSVLAYLHFPILK